MSDSDRNDPQATARRIENQLGELVRRVDAMEGQHKTLEEDVKRLRGGVGDLSALLHSEMPTADEIRSGRHARGNMRQLAEALGIQVSVNAPAEQQRADWRRGFDEAVKDAVSGLAQADVERVIDGWRTEVTRLSDVVRELSGRLAEVESKVQTRTEALVARLEKAETVAAAAEASLAAAREQMTELGGLADALLDVANDLNQVVAGGAPAREA